MKGVEIRKLIELDPFVNLHFDGVFARDSRIRLHKHSHFAIINTDKKRQPGQHWVFALRTGSTLEFFDPLGKKSGGARDSGDTTTTDSDSDDGTTKTNDSGADSIARKHGIFWRNRSLLEGIQDLIVPPKQYQPSGSENCGLFCVYVAYHRMRRLDQPFSHVLSTIFGRDPAANEQRVERFAQQLTVATSPPR